MSKILKSSFCTISFFKVIKLPSFNYLNGSKRNFSAADSSLSDANPVQVQEDDSRRVEKELEIEKLRNKSRLRTDHRNILLEKVPYSEPLATHHITVKYHRKMYGKYGSESGVNPGIMWPTKEDLEARREYEKVAFPFTIQELVNAAKEEIQQRELKTQQEHDRVLENMKKLGKWKTELKERIAKKEAEALAAKEKKEKLIEEVRRHFGFKIDPKDERFKEALELKEKEQKKKEKKAKMEEKTKKEIARLMNKEETSSETTKSVG